MTAIHNTVAKPHVEIQNLKSKINRAVTASKGVTTTKSNTKKYNNPNPTWWSAHYFYSHRVIIHDGEIWYSRTEGCVAKSTILNRMKVSIRVIPVNV